MRHQFSNLRRLALLPCLATVVLLPAPVSAQEITRGPDGTISVRAADVPLGRLLAGIGDIQPFEKLVVKNGVDARLVTVTVENVTVHRALVEVLKSAGVDYVLGDTRLVVGVSAFSGGASPLAGGEEKRAVYASGDDADRSRDDADRRTAEGEAPPPSSPPIDIVLNEAEANVREAELQRALAPPALPIAPGAPIDLPFPGPDGRTPLSEVKPFKQPANVLPFPVAPGTQTPSAAPRSTDPRVQQLIDALSPKRGPGQ